MATTFFTEVVDGSTTAHGQVSLALDPSNAPWIAYTTPSGDVMLATRSDTGWECERLPSEPAAHDDYRIGLGIDEGLNPHVAYQSRATDHLIYGVRGTQWSFEEVPTSAGLFPDRVRFPSMTVNRGVFSEQPFKNRPHFAYQSGLSLWHATKAPPKADPTKPATWKKNVHVVDESNLAEKGWFPALTFDHRDETLRIAYFDDLSPAGQSVRRLRVATMSPGTDFVGQPDSWHVQVLHGGQILGEHPAMGHSITGESVVSYCERTGRTLNVCVFGNFPESPAVEVVTGDVDNDDVHPACGVGHPSRICVVYGSGGRLRFAVRTGIGTYAVEDVEAGGAWSDVRFDDVGSPHVAHIAAGTLRYGVGDMT
ncbi:hypothetical protein TU94_10755 [Streptomyces cyaneogriseus subsp. noncyanogenus]|uniref:Uncharacterized protein n=1 Tax=Streptomyces cyaneogriseus subsp. noncyanogenus TaxID=477245 RepID=A0A0C5FPN5_9ACTN|nr:hypothetical protein [Streptomyces cyaneogriseus]AJP01917.1 hypothetical protein TU94_10755 [Streptomyces cyaneogriseus subsp. noncyanogenus]